MIQKEKSLNHDRGKKISLGEDIDRSAFEEILKFIRLRVTDVYAYPPEIVQVDGITIATLGNFSASTGKPKSKKTFNVSAIVASALSGKEVLRYKATLPKEKHKVLYVVENLIKLIPSVSRILLPFSSPTQVSQYACSSPLYSCPSLQFVIHK